MFDVITIGSATVDVFAQTESELIKFKTVHGEDDFIAYPSGSKILITDLQFLIGGGGTNTAVSFARLGLKTGYVGKLGKDTHGKMVLDLLKKEKVSFLGGYGKDTGYSIILDSIEDDRSILTYKGAVNELELKDVKKKSFQASWLYVSSMMGKSYETMLALVKQAKAQGGKIAFNPSSYQAKQGKEHLQDMLSLVDVLVLNKEEAKYLVGPVPLEYLLKRLRDLEPKIVVVTDGRRGTFVYDSTKVYHAIPQRHLTIKETTGAGDAFASTFVAGLILKKSIPDCIKMGMLNAESVIQNYGAKNILLSRKKLLALLKKDARTVHQHPIRSEQKEEKTR